MKKVFFLTYFLFQIFTLKAQLNTDRLLNMGYNALYFKDYVLSIQYFNQIIKAKPYLEKPYLYRAIAKISLYDYTGALVDLDTVISKNEFIPLAYYARGFAYNRLEKYDLAQNDFTRALELEPDNSLYIRNRLEAYSGQKKYAEEFKDLDYLLSKYGKDTDLSLEKGRALVLNGDTIGAFEVMNNLVGSDSLDFKTWGGRALINLIMEKKDSALSDYNQAVKLNSNDPNHYINRGILLYEKKDYRGALADCDKAITLSPNNVQVLYNRSLLRTEIADYNNAILDLNRLLELDPEMYEAVYQRALVNQQMGKHNESIEDFTKIIEKYPDFVPAYYARSVSYQALRYKNLVYKDMQTIVKLEEEHGKNPNKKKDIDIEAKVAQETSSSNSWAKLFTPSANAKKENNFENNSVRGDIQNRDVEVKIQDDFVLSPYVKSAQIDKKTFFSVSLNDFNRENGEEMALRFVNEEVPLTDALIQYHFKTIDNLSDKIKRDGKDANFYFLRGINFSLVKDFSSAINDFSKVINLKSDALAYFCRAEMRKKQLEVSVVGIASEIAEKDHVLGSYSILTEKKFSADFEIILRDYDKAIELSPDFSYAWFNRANVLCFSKDYRSAIENYTNAIKIDRNFAEAFYNRGLTYIFTGETEKGIADLSKAGELGIYQVYNLLKKLRR
ncbi:MAG: tetratricopeptide repeat protein [Prevotellaceae bacterium]|jgi:tetratricopeptide (TPR) repeat protein|nr:tetratricopeptide repeat protein [Prevotellaceae bacterium]